MKIHDFPHFRSKKICENFENFEKVNLQKFLFCYENPIFLLNYANLLHQNKRYNEAMYYYQRSIDIDTRFPEAHFNIADI